MINKVQKRAGRNIRAFCGILIPCFTVYVVCYLFLACHVIGGDVETMRPKPKLTVTFEANGGMPEPARDLGHDRIRDVALTGVEIGAGVHNSVFVSGAVSPMTRKRSGEDAKSFQCLVTC